MDKNSEIAIHVDGVYKNFRLPHEKSSTLKSAFVNILKGKRNRSTSVQHALKNISFDIKKGEFFGIVGRNGSGKSTLLKILAGIYQPTQGKVVTHGKLVPFIELGVGFNPELSGRDNVYLNGSLLGFSKDEIDNMYEKIVEFAELEQFMDQKLKNYSSGMQVRLAFSMAVRADADILLVDEVLAVGDADFQRKCFDYFRELKKHKKTVVFISHDMTAVTEYCDRALLINDSEIVDRGSAIQVAKQYTRMFIEDANNDASAGSVDDKRFGDGSASYTSVSLSKKKLTDDIENITIELKAKANEDIEDPVFGFSIKNSSGSQILGTNSMIKGLKTKPLVKGEVVDITWTVPNVFADGLHFVDLALVSHGGATTCDWWEQACTFTVVNEEITPYIVNPLIGISIQEDESPRLNSKSRRSNV